MAPDFIPSSLRYLLDEPVLAHVATIGPRGEPQANPCWFLWREDLLWLAIGPTGQKARNLERDPRIAVSMVDATEPGRYLELRGRAIEWRTVGSMDPAVVAMVRKYTGNDTYEGRPDEHTLVGIELNRATFMR
jgi:PPOX class probable F420-dependent enzyme